MVAIGSVPVVLGLFGEVGLTVEFGFIVWVDEFGVVLVLGWFMVELLGEELRDPRVERGEVVDIVSGWVVVPVEPGCCIVPIVP